MGSAGAKAAHHFTLSDTAAHPLLVSIVAPTFNEKDNVGRFAASIDRALDGINYEIVFVDDDSTDGTRSVVAELAQTNPRIRLIHRIGRRGLATAVVEGMLSTTAPYIAVLDADNQHDETALPGMLRTLQASEADLVVGSRYVAGGSIGTWDEGRARKSMLATKLAAFVTRTKLTDPMSGYFAITRSALYQSVRNLSGQGYKILLDICASSEAPLRIREVPYEFRNREAGESKLDALVAWEYILLLIDKSIGHVIPARFVSFMMIGGFGVFVHMAAMFVALKLAGLPFAWAQGMATGLAMIFNFFVNNTLTYRDRRLRGFWPTFRGLLSFILVCSVGAVANVGIAQFLFADFNYRWWAAALAGIVVGSVWNYAATSIVTWRAR